MSCLKSWTVDIKQTRAESERWGGGRPGTSELREDTVGPLGVPVALCVPTPEEVARNAGDADRGGPTKSLLSRQRTKKGAP